MGFNPDIHHRRTTRLHGYNYSASGFYHVVVCTYLKQYLFGDVINSQMYLNELGRVVYEEWLRTPEMRRNVLLDEFIVMPNHLHGILIIDNENIAGATRQVAMVGASCRIPLPDDPFVVHGPKSGSIGAILAGFKSSVTVRINHLRNTPSAKVWQRNYYDHIIRNEDELNWARYYIRQNPANWDQDEENPECIAK